jgi:predicted ferric reductase
MKKFERKRAIADQVTWLTGLGLGLTLTMQITTLSSFDFIDPYAVITTISRVFALVGSYLAIIGLFLIARIPWVERSLGHDRLVVWHRKAMPYALFFIAIHVLLVLLGNAGANQKVIAVQLWEYITGYEWMLAATVGLILMIMAGVTSYKRVRKKIKYETWWVIHLYTYLAVTLSFMHQVLHGSMFAGHPLNRAYWTGLYLAVAFSILTWRVALPVYRSLRHELRVERIEVESPQVFSIYISGRDIDRLKAQGGQFFNWRFLTKEKWLENHPFSLSATPTDGQLRITVKVLGDGTATLSLIPVGTRVMIEGPYGIFTRDVASQTNHALLVAGGVGITPIRAMIDELPASTKIDLIYRASRIEDVVLREELDFLEKTGRISLHLLIGSRAQFPMKTSLLEKLVPEFRRSDIYVCGPDSLIEALLEVSKENNIGQQQIHHEFFEYQAS